MKVTVVGAGISGLATAWFLHRDHDAHVVVLEATERVGGKLRSEEVGGVALDLGADSFLARQPHVERLVRRLGLGDELVAPATSRVSVWTRGGLRRLPSGTILGVPTEVVPLLRSGVLSWRGVARAALDLVKPRDAVTADRSVGALVASRFGREVVDVLVDPLLGGVYAGDPYRLSVEATTPVLADAARSGRSLLLALRRRRRAAADDGGPMFLTLRDGGMGRLAVALADDLPSGSIRYGEGARRIAHEDSRAVVETDNGTAITSDALVLAVPAHRAAPLVEPLAPRVAETLAGIDYASVATIALVYPRPVVQSLPEGSGMLVPSREGRLVKAVTFVDAKWAHQRRDEQVLLRASVGRAGDSGLPPDDGAIVGTVISDLEQMLGIRGEPLAIRVTRWERALPQYEPGHLDRIGSARTQLAEVGPLHLAGAGYDGVGVASCVAAAQLLARRLVT
ncbi:MAG: protoporphyrinogen oxidase [Actinobacteria bacterium]|nr:protoporphyrinogen oxidase [Actinomycetota bacterium]